MKFLLLLILFFTISCTNHKKIKQLKFIKSYEIETHNSIEPSGLTEWNGDFYTVSDKHNLIYQLEFKNKLITLNPIIKIDNDSETNFDFEGITHDDEFFYLVSEELLQVLKVSKNGEHQEWISNSGTIQKAGQEAGLFKVENAKIEGVCKLTDNTILMVAERQPRGFIEFKSTLEILAYQENDINFDYEKNRSPDFSGLSCEDGMYALSRNAYMVAELSMVNGKYREIKGYSYKHIVTKPEYQYQNMEYGHAEGLVVKEDRVYILLDNNKSPNNMNPKNNNSLFLELLK